MINEAEKKGNLKESVNNYGNHLRFSQNLSTFHFSQQHPNGLGILDCLGFNDKIHEVSMGSHAKVFILSGTL